MKSMLAVANYVQRKMNEKLRKLSVEQTIVVYKLQKLQMMNHQLEEDNNLLKINIFKQLDRLQSLSERLRGLEESRNN